MPTLRTVTLGCKVNQYETEYVRQGLAGAGFRDAADAEPADLCVVNTCTVTHEGDAKSRQTIRRLARDNPAARIVVMGCYATRAPDEVAALPNVVEVVRDKRELPDLLGRWGVVDVPTGISTFAGRQRAFVKVQDGCLLRCSFCIIPHVRPELHSRPAEQIVAEVRRLVDHGFREVVLTGIHLGHYGVDLNRGRPRSDWVRLADLVRRIARLPGDFRVRLSSIEATEVTRDLIDAFAEFPDRVCPHLHVSLQSGSDDILRRMGRRWGARRIIDRCELARRRLDRPAFTTDIIVGFPGETAADFAATCRVAEEIGFSRVHIFPFSPRRGTPAATLADQIPPPVKAARVAELERLAGCWRDEYYRTLLGDRWRAIVEGEFPDRPGTLLATTCRYASVEVAGAARERGEFIDIVAEQVRDGALIGRPRRPADAATSPAPGQTLRR